MKALAVLLLLLASACRMSAGADSGGLADAVNAGEPPPPPPAFVAFCERYPDQALELPDGARLNTRDPIRDLRERCR